MVLSEFLIWNIHPAARMLSLGPLGALLLVVPYLGYTAVFAVLADTVVRRKVRDFWGLVLLGSLYGLFNEGVLADKVYAAGPGPRMLGLHPVVLLTMSGSWHALIDVALGFTAFSAALSGRLGLGEPGLTRRQWLAAACLAVWWFSWSRFKVVQHWFPGGLPPGLQTFWLALAMALVGLTARAALSATPAEAPAEVLGPWARRLAWALAALSALLRLWTLPDPRAALAFCGAGLFYWALFRLHCRMRPAVPERSIYEEAFPARGGFSTVKYLKLCAIVYGVFASLSVLDASWQVGRFFTVLDSLLVAGFVIFAAVAPLAALAAVAARAAVR